MSRGPKSGDFGVDWDAEAIRASKVQYPYTSGDFFNYFRDLVEPHDRVLEIGCSIASWIWAWRNIEPTVRYEGLDWSEVAIDVAEERYGFRGGVPGKNIHLKPGTSYSSMIDAQFLPFNLKKKIIGHPAVFYHMDARDMDFHEVFDIVFTHTFYQHTSIETKNQVAPRVAEALRPGGLHIIQENTSYESKGTWFKQGWIDFFERFGFKCIRTHDMGGGGTGFVFRK